MFMPLGSVAVVSLEPWDEVWRRNQHLASRLVAQGHVQRLTFICPPTKLRHVPTQRPTANITALTPHLFLPRSSGGLGLVARELRVWGVGRADVLWVNDAVLGARLITAGQATLYDVTDDWRRTSMASSERRRLVAAEDALAMRATTVVCSDVLRERWQERYGVDAHVVQNGVDLAGHKQARAVDLAGPGPHVMYVGTLHDERLDLSLVLAAADRAEVGSVHLVGPDHLSVPSRASIASHPKVLSHGPVPHAQVPDWMAGADVLFCPHLIDDFTLSLDAIKAFEYLAATKPVVATASSGFQSLAPQVGLHVAPAERFLDALMLALASPVPARPPGGQDWDERAGQFADLLRGARRG